MEWQPILTAPTDGTRIIVYYPEFDPKNYEIKYGHLPSQESEDEYKLWDDDGIYVCWFDGYTDAQIFDQLCSDEELDNQKIKHGYWRFNSTALDEEYTDGDVVDFQGGIWEGPTHWLPIPKVPK